MAFITLLLQQPAFLNLAAAQADGGDAYGVSALNLWQVGYPDERETKSALLQRYLDDDKRPRWWYDIDVARHDPGRFGSHSSPIPEGLERFPIVGKHGVVVPLSGEAPRRRRFLRPESRRDLAAPARQFP